MRKKLSFSVFVVFTILLAGSQCIAQNSISLTGTVPTFYFVTISDYENTKIYPKAITLVISKQQGGDNQNDRQGGNSKGYRVMFKAITDFISPSNKFINLDRVALKLTNNPMYPIALSKSDQVLISSKRSPKKDGDEYNIDFIANPLGYNYDPDTYTVTVLFTLTGD